jgi:hypothetical protein
MLEGYDLQEAVLSTHAVLTDSPLASQYLRKGFGVQE